PQSPIHCHNTILTPSATPISATSTSTTLSPLAIPHQLKPHSNSVQSSLLSTVILLSLRLSCNSQSISLCNSSTPASSYNISGSQCIHHRLQSLVNSAIMLAVTNTRSSCNFLSTSQEELNNQHLHLLSNSTSSESSSEQQIHLQLSYQQKPISVPCSISSNLAQNRFSTQTLASLIYCSSSSLSRPFLAIKLPPATTESPHGYLL
ncbi:hypothetical protein C5167_013260, partial [Papaver somniferum]